MHGWRMLSAMPSPPNRVGLMTALAPARVSLSTESSPSARAMMRISGLSALPVRQIMALVGSYEVVAAIAEARLTPASMSTLSRVESPRNAMIP